MKVVTMTAYNRPKYLVEVLTNLACCDGIREYFVFLSIDPGNNVVENIHKHFPAGVFGGFSHKVNSSRLGCGENTLRALSVGFTMSDFVIHLEDDTVPGKDFLRYMEWAAGAYRGDKSVFSVAGHSMGLPPPEKRYEVYRDEMFSPWGWGTWEDRFEEMVKAWIPKEDRNNSWDTHLRDKVRGGRCCVRPRLSRTFYIGRDGGTWGSPEHYDANYKNQSWVGSVKVEEGSFHE